MSSFQMSRKNPKNPGKNPWALGRRILPSASATKRKQKVRPAFVLRCVDAVPRCIHYGYPEHSNSLTLGQFLHVLTLYRHSLPSWTAPYYCLEFVLYRTLTDSFPVPDDPFNAHFGALSRYRTDTTLRNVAERQWKSSTRSCGKLGSAVLQVPEGVDEDTVKSKIVVSPGSIMLHSQT